MKLTFEQLRSRKRDGKRIVMLTCYDYPTARIEDACGVDVLLVGDSVGTNVLGYPDVSHVTMDDMAHHVSAVARGARQALVLGDLPFGSFANAELAVTNARRLVDCGADGVKMEGEDVSLIVAAVVSAGVPVCAHVGYTPQTDGARATVQGKDFARAKELVDVSLELQSAGASLIVLELLPERLAGEITGILSIPTIGIGAGRYCDGQVQVVFDILGLSPRTFRHAKVYGSVAEAEKTAVLSYAREVREGLFPTEQNASRIEDAVYTQIAGWVAERGLRGAA